MLLFRFEIIRVPRQITKTSDPMPRGSIVKPKNEGCLEMDHINFWNVLIYQFDVCHTPTYEAAVLRKCKHWQWLKTLEISNYLLR